MHRSITFGILMTMVFHQGVLADWVTVISSPEAGIDSIERVLTIRDYKDSTFLGRRLLMPLGDVNGDGYDDFVAARVRLLSTLQDDSLFLFLGGPAADGSPDAAYDLEVLTGGHTNPGERFEVGDINGDGFPDIGITRGAFPVCEFHFWNNGFSDPPNVSIPGLWSFIPQPGDMTANGMLNIALAKDKNGLNGNTVYVFDLAPPYDTIPEYTIADTTKRFGSVLAIGDVNGDGIPDLIVSTRFRSSPDSSIIKFYWGGTDFDTIPDFVMARPERDWGWILAPIGDINADGYDDLFISGASHGPYGVYFGGPAFDSTIDIPILGIGAPAYPTDVDARGDINGDGYSDLIVGINDTNGGIEQVFIYFGGPAMDSQFDIFMTSADIPGLQVNVGFSVAAIGDFTGDGIDDFAVHSRTSSGGNWRSEINIFAGWRDTISTGTGGGGGGVVLPVDFELFQNYPNPFNPSTTISFSLPEKAYVTLTIHNVLGQRVKTLLSHELSAGTHSAVWDGTDAHGEDVASGVYVYRLMADEVVLSRKMVLAR